jgi:membrane peptidoglycan carboxypeptidase
MGTNAKAGQTFLNYTVPTKYGSAAGFQPGSTFKFFVMAAALEEGLPETTSFFAPQTLSVPQNEYRTCQGMYSNFADWTLSNSTTSTNQTMNMDVGAPQSVNTYFAQLERRTGICKAYQLANEMGVDLPRSAQVPSFTLGVADANPLEMASAYATAASGGTYCNPHPISAILDSNGQVVKKYPTQCKQVLSQHTADTINSVLHRVMAPGGFGSGLTLNRPAAGKTGTNSANMAVWFNGYTPALSVSTVVSGVNKVGHPIPVPPTLGGIYYGTAHGSTVAGPMWAAALRPVEDLIPFKDFNAPGTGPDQFGLPDVLGSGVRHAMTAIKNAGYTPVLAGVVDSSYSGGEVGQVSMGADDQTVYIFTSSGHGAPAAPVYHPPSGHRGRGHGHGGGGGKPGH